MEKFLVLINLKEERGRGGSLTVQGRECKVVVGNCLVLVFIIFVFL